MIGRESELALLEDFIAGDGAPQATVITGDAGIGKTTLWQAAVDGALRHGLRVLAARGTPSEAQLPFVALADLLDGVELASLDLPDPQRSALEIALLLEEPEDQPPEPQAVALGFLGALRALSSEVPVLIAVDDVPWLDAGSAEALSFAARRAKDLPTRFLIARRPGSPPDLEKALGRLELQELGLGPLSVGVIRRMVFERLGLRLTRREQRSIFESSQGNPLYALELARTADAGAEGRVPPALEDLLAFRVGGLPAETRKLVVAAALEGDLRLPQALVITGQAALDDAVHRGVIHVEGDRVVTSHPMLGAAARGVMPPNELRAVHVELAESATLGEQRARHLALATEEADLVLADLLASTAERAFRRGAARDAAELAGHALRLTPPDAPAREDRLLLRAGYLLDSGELHAVTDLLRSQIPSLSPSARARAFLYLADSAAVSSTSDYTGYLDQALEAATGNVELTSAGLWRKAEYQSVGRVENLAEAETIASRAVSAATEGGPDERPALVVLGWVRILRGHPVDDLAEQFRLTAEAPPNLYRSFDRLVAVRASWRGEISAARQGFAHLVETADEQGDGWSYSVLRLNLCEVELRAGAWTTVDGMVDAWEESLEAEFLLGAPGARLRALAAAGRGEHEAAERWAVQAISDAEESGMRWEHLEALRARGTAALAARDAPKAVECLRAVWEHTERHEVTDPGTFPVGPDLVEALVEVDRIEEANEIARRLQELGELQEHPWALAGARRSRAILEPGEETFERLLGAVADYERHGLLFDDARSLLALGRAQRRVRKWADARNSLERSAEAFDGIGSSSWAGLAREELARIPARRPRATGELTPSEQRVAELAAAGFSNKEIAQQLVITVHTVEAHLSKAYAKLGVRSRGQLGRRLSSPD